MKRIYDKTWEEFGLSYPDSNPYHQPQPDPWYAGGSVFERVGVQAPQPEGPLFHVVFPESSKGTEILHVGESLLSPASRRVLTERMGGLLRGCGCIECVYYDVHAVYLTEDRPQDDCFYYVVEPEGLLWPDPELGHHSFRAWCARSGTITEVNIPSSLRVATSG